MRAENISECETRNRTLSHVRWPGRAVVRGKEIKLLKRTGRVENVGDGAVITAFNFLRAIKSGPFNILPPLILIVQVTVPH